MKKIKRLYRKDYQGENVVTDIVMSNKQWEVTQEWLGNSVINNQISNQACVIGNGISRKEFDVNAVLNHFGGILGTLKLQTYGCNALYRDHTPDFLVVTGDDDGMVAEVADSGYCDTHIVYADAPHIQNHPNKFYLIPQDPGWNSGSLATYLAAFDGHSKIYLLGFDGQDTEAYNYNCYAGSENYQPARHTKTSPDFFELTMKHIFDTYSEVDFVRVMPTKFSTMPESWKFAQNLRQISFREFILEADL